MQASNTSKNDAVVALETVDVAEDVNVFVTDYETQAEIGLFDSERGRKQRVRFNVSAGCHYDALSDCQTQDSVVCYKSLVDEIEDELKKGHVETVEALADQLCKRFMQDARILWVTLKIEKLEAVMGAGSVGIQMTRRRSRTAL